MSASKSKIKSATCTKCKQGFKFKRVPKMTSVVCPHCNATIRQVKPARLPVPGLVVSQVEFPDMDELDVDESVVDIVDVPVIETRRTREETLADVEQAEDDSSPNIKVHRSRRKNVDEKARPTQNF